MIEMITGGKLMFGFIGNIGPWELIVIMLIALIVVGPSKLPEVARSMGKALNDFKRATSGVQREFEEALKYEPAPPKNNANADNASSTLEEEPSLDEPGEDTSEDANEEEIASNENTNTKVTEEDIEPNTKENLETAENDNGVADNTNIDEKPEHNPYQ